MATPTRLPSSEQLRSVDSRLNSQEQRVETLDARLLRSDTTTRQTIAKYFVFTYFALLALILLGVPLYDLIAYHLTHDVKSLQLSLTDVIQTYSAVAGPTLGFVIAYYFKSRNEN